LFLAGGLGLVMIILFSLKLAFAIVLGIPILVLSGALAFGRVGGIPLWRYLISMAHFAFKPQKYLWRKK